MKPEEFLHFVVYRRIHRGVGEIDEIGAPLGAAALGEERGVGREADDVGVALEGGEAGGFGEGGAEGVAAVFFVGGVFAEVDGGFGAVVGVVAAEVFPEPVRREVLMFVDQGDGELGGELPAELEILAAGEGAGGADDDDLGMLFAQGVVDHAEALLEVGVDLVLVADA